MQLAGTGECRFRHFYSARGIQGDDSNCNKIFIRIPLGSTDGIEYHKEAMGISTSRIASAFVESGLGWLRNIRKSLRALWLETTGALYLGLGLLAIPSAWKEWNRYSHGGPLWRILAVGVFMALSLGFGIYSFIKARQIR